MSIRSKISDIIPRNMAQLFVLSVIAMCFGEAGGTSLIGGKYRLISVSISAFFLLFSFKRKVRDKLNIIPFNFAICAVLLCAVSFPFWDTTYNIYSYVGVVVAYLVYTADANYANKWFVILVVLSVVLMSYEFFNKQFLFVNVVHGIEFDEHEFGGSVGVFRAKGLFYGPTLVGVFAVLAYFINSRNIKILLMGILICFLANSRTGLVILAVPLMLFLFQNHFRKYLVCLIVAGLILINVSALLSPDVITSVERIGSLSEGSDGQSSRIFFWLRGIQTFLDYPIIHMLFGNNGHFKSIYDNNPESGWICLLTDTGVVGFCFYFMPVIFALIVFFKRNEWFNCLLVCLFVFLNSIITANLSSTSSLVYWFFMFELMNSVKYKITKIKMQ